MCIDKEANTCCCGCSLTTATWIIGFLDLLSLVSQGFSHNWLGVGTSGAVCILFILTVIKRNSVTIRKYLYWVYYVLSIAFAVLFAVAIIAFCFLDFADESFEDTCEETPELYPNKYERMSDCISFLRTLAIVVLCIVYLISVPIRFALARVLYYGWKEQEDLAAINS